MKRLYNYIDIVSYSNWKNCSTCFITQNLPLFNMWKLWFALYWK